MITNTHGYNWAVFKGSPEALKWNRRDLDVVDTVVSHVRQRRVVVQAGGNLGIFPKHLSRSFQTVYTFEPAADLFPLMMMNAPEPNILRFQAALGYQRDLVGTCRVRRDGKPTNHEGITHIAGSGSIPTLRVDDLQLPICDLLYLDLEGWEFYALQGSRETLARCRPVVAVEINKSIGYVGLSREDVRQLLIDSWYTSVLRVHSDELFLPNEQLQSQVSA